MRSTSAPAASTFCVTFGPEPQAGTGPHSPPESRQDLSFGSASPESLERLKAVLNEARVGVRLVVAGPSADIYAARAAAAECGMVEEEMTLLHRVDGQRRVFCAHCRATTLVPEAAGVGIGCSGCATVLSVSEHFSRRLAAYLGYAANAEEAA
jgi:dimethylamine monooxygenase subunit C